MPLLSFSVLKPKLLDGSKTQTIRLPRKHPLKVGDKLYVYWKCRTKETEKLGESKITKIVCKRIMDLNRLDAERDGFKDGYGLSAVGHLRATLYRLHPDLTEESFVEIISFDALNFIVKEQSTETPNAHSLSLGAVSYGCGSLSVRDNSVPNKVSPNQWRIKK